MRNVFIINILLCAGNSVAAVNCIGVPSSTKVGEFGAQESYLIVSVGGLDFRLGLLDDQGAKLRFAIANIALSQNKNILLKFYNPYVDCGAASVDRVIPNSVQIIQ